MRVLVTGSRGLLGGEVCKFFAAAGDDVVPLDRTQLDIGNRDAIRLQLEEHSPDWIVNCAAYTDVDGAESETDRNIAANALGPGNLALEGKRVGSGLITVSTDYVFDGANDGFYTQRDDPDPLSEYGKAKLHGERLASASNARTIIVRVGWLFGKNGRNFLSKIPEIAATGAPMKAIRSEEHTSELQSH